MWLGLRWNGHSKTFWPLTFELYGRNIAPVHFKNDRVAETALRASWFWQNSARFPRSLAIFSTPGDSKVTPDGLGFQWNRHRNTFWTRTFELAGRNIAPVHFKNDRVAETALRASWFWQHSAWSPRTRAIFSSRGNSKLTPDGLGFQGNRHRNTFWTRTFELACRNIALLFFKTERVGGSALRALWFWGSSGRSGET